MLFLFESIRHTTTIKDILQCHLPKSVMAEMKLMIFLPDRYEHEKSKQEIAGKKANERFYSMATNMVGNTSNMMRIHIRTYISSTDRKGLSRICFPRSMVVKMGRDV